MLFYRLVFSSSINVSTSALVMMSLIIFSPGSKKMKQQQATNIIAAAVLLSLNTFATAGESSKENLAKITNNSPLKVTTSNTKNTLSLGNPFEQFQLSQGNLSATTTAAFPQPKAFVNSQLMWDTRSIPVCYLPGTNLSFADHTTIKTAAEKWETATKMDPTSTSNSLLKFTGWGICATANPFGIKIVIDNTVPNSGVGTESNGSNPINVINGFNASMHLNVFTTNPAPTGFDPCRTGTEANRANCIDHIVVHEFGHALGFIHEIVSPLTPQPCWDQFGFTLTNPPDNPWMGDLTLTNQWDADSVMTAYAAMACNPTPNNSKGILSRLDKLAVKTWYGNIPSYTTWNNTAVIPSVDINGQKYAVNLTYQGMVGQTQIFNVASVTATAANSSASEAIFTNTNNVLHIPLLRYQDQANKPNFVTDLYDVYLAYNTATARFSMTSANLVR